MHHDGLLDGGFIIDSCLVTLIIPIAMHYIKATKLILDRKQTFIAKFNNITLNVYM